MRLWLTPPENDAVEDFRALYADPLTVNGVEMTVRDLVGRARAVHTGLADVSIEVLKVVEAPGHVAVAFIQRGCHVGPLSTPLGELAATGRTVEARVIDILTLVDGKVTEIFMTADELGRLVALGAVGLVQPAGASS
jgi:hypothetical protein